MGEYLLLEYYNMFKALAQVDADFDAAPQRYDINISITLHIVQQMCIFFKLHSFFIRYVQNNPDVVRVPSPDTFRRLRNRLLRDGCLLPPHNRAGRPAMRVPLEVEDQIIEEFTADANLSTRLCAVRFGLDHFDVWKVLHDAGIKPYK